MISYLSCSEGKLDLHHYENGNHEIVCSSNNVNELANCLANYGFGEFFRTSSSLDFADEYGFETMDGAHDLLEAACIEAYKIIEIHEEYEKGLTPNYLL
tara:strand:+ start:16372 stop:16668 length:297 start_codon:yes stop_codon:yes gene_type:complete